MKELNNKFFLIINVVINKISNNFKIKKYLNFIGKKELKKGSCWPVTGKKNPIIKTQTSKKIIKLFTKLFFLKKSKEKNFFKI